MIICRSPQEIAKIQISAQLAAATLQHITPMIQPGVTTAELDRVAETYIRKCGGLPAFKGYRGFPATLCTSINSEVVHGIPSKKRKLIEGDIVGIDCGAIIDGYYGDHAITFAVDPITEEAQQLIDTTREALYVGIAQAKIGNYLSEVVTVDGRLSAHFEHTITVAEHGGIILSYP